MSLSFFHNTTSGEAFTREACMIEAIGGCGPSPLPLTHPTFSHAGLSVLTNVLKGHAEEPVAKWAPNRKRLFGIHLLRRALNVFVADAPREIFHNDL